MEKMEMCSKHYLIWEGGDDEKQGNVEKQVWLTVLFIIKQAEGQ